MGEFFYNGLSFIYGPSMSESVTSFLTTIIATLSTVFTNTNIEVILNIFIGASVAFLILYFYWDLNTQATRDMLTLEKTIVCCIRLVVAAAILIYLPELIEYLFKLAKAVYASINSADLSGLSVNGHSIQYFPSVSSDPSHWPSSYSEVEDVFKDAFGSKIKSFFSNFGSVLAIALIYIIMWAARIAAYFIALSNAIMLIVRVIFSPIAVVNCFEDGQRSAGIRYLKKLLSTALTFAIIAAVLKAAQVFNDALLANSLSQYNYILDYGSGVTSLKDIMSGPDLILGAIPQVAAVGAMLMGARFSDEIVGVR